MSVIICCNLQLSFYAGFVSFDLFVYVESIMWSRFVWGLLEI